MANYKAVANGNWSALATWQDDSTGSYVASTVLPGAADVVYWNNFTVTIDQDVTVLEIRNNSTTGVTAGGTGTVSTSRTINADLFHATGSLITVSATSPSVVNINGNMPGTSAAATSRGVNITGTATLNYVGNIVGATTGLGGNTCGILMGSASVVNVTGNVSAGSTGGNNNGNSQYGIRMGQNCTLNIVGNVTGGVGGTSLGFGVYVSASNSVLNITGVVYGGQTIFNRITMGVLIEAGISSNVSITGGLVAGPYAHALYCIDANGSTKPSISGYLINDSIGIMAAFCSYLMLNSISNSSWEFRKSDFTTNTLYSPGVAIGFPATNNVRTGITYGPINNLTGTCAVPPANTVSLGVPVDNTVGTASLDANALAVALDAALTASLAPALTTSLDASLSASLPAAIAPLLWDEDVANITTPNSIGERLKNCATVATTGAQISSFNP